MNLPAANAYRPYFVSLVVLLVVLQLLLHLPHFQKPLLGHHVWRQTETQSNIDNFFEEDFNIFSPRINARGNRDGIVRKEFPLLQWMIAVTYLITDKSVVVTRVWMFIISLIAMWGMFQLLKSLFDCRWVALAGAWMFSFSPAFFYYAINPMPDVLALCFGMWGLAIFQRTVHSQNTAASWGAGLLLSLAILCKLPFILFFAVPLSYHLLFSAHRHVLERLKNLLPFLVPMLLPVIWYALVIPGWQGNGIVTGIAGSKVSVTILLSYLWKNMVSIFPELIINYAALPLFIIGVFFNVTAGFSPGDLQVIPEVIVKPRRRKERASSYSLSLGFYQIQNW